jgi:hypothetical protein
LNEELRVDTIFGERSELPYDGGENEELYLTITINEPQNGQNVSHPTDEKRPLVVKGKYYYDYCTKIANHKSGISPQTKYISVKAAKERKENKMIKAETN